MNQSRYALLKESDVSNDSTEGDDDLESSSFVSQSILETQTNEATLIKFFSESPKCLGAHKYLQSSQSINTHHVSASTSEHSDDDDPSNDHESITHFIYELILSQKRYMSYCILFQLIQVLLELTGPAFIGIMIHLVSNPHTFDYKSNYLSYCGCYTTHYITDNAYNCTHDATQTLIILVIVYLLFQFVCAIFTGFASTYKRFAGQNILKEVRCNLFESLMYSEMKLFDKVPCGELNNRLSQDVTELGDVISYELTNRIGSLCTLCGCIIYILFISWKLCLLLMIVFPIIALLSNKYGQYFERKSKLTQDSYAVASGIANEAMSNIRTVRCCSNEVHHINQYKQQIEATRQIAFQMATARGQYRALVLCLDSIGMAIIMIVGGILVLQNEMNIADYTTFILYSILIKSNMKDIIEMFSSFKSAIGSTSQVFDYIKNNNKHKLYSPSYCIQNTISGQIEFKNIKFTYPTRKSQVIFDGFNLKLKAKTVTALVGLSGSGKSTLCSLLMGVYKLDEGKIYVDNVDLNTMDLEYLHRHNIGMVSQEPVLFSGTIADNISYGQSEVHGLRDIIEAATLANADEFVSSFKNGYNTRIGERGVTLSGGQKQRIAIARCFLMNPEILVLDEATSALDSKSEQLIDDALNVLFKNKTVLIVAHRLSTVKNADSILVMDKGKIIERGTHDQLMLNNDSFYYLLFKKQFT